MSTKLNEFIANVKQGVAKTQYFTVQLNLPRKLNTIFQQDMRKVILFCDQAQLPGISFSTSQVRSFGEFKEVPYEKLYEQVTLSFYVDVDMVVRRLFDSWVELVQNPTTREFNYPSQYLTNTIEIIVNDSQNQDRYKVTLHKAYPKAIAPIQLDYAGKDVMKLQVTFSYQNATSEMFAVGTREGDDPISALTNQMPNFSYGFAGLTAIPTDYINDFNTFQDSFKNVDFSEGGVKSLITSENIGEITGFGNIFV